MSATRPYPERLPPVELTCAECGKSFTRSAWRVRQAERSGTTPRCSYACAHAARRINTPETKAAYHRAYREKNRDQINEKQNAARFGPKREHILNVQREGYYRNIEKSRQRAREYAASHKEEANARRKAWPEQNPERALFHQARSDVSRVSGIATRNVPDELAENKAMLLRIRRAIRDRDGGGEAGQTAKQAGPEGQQPGPKGSP